MGQKYYLLFGLIALSMALILGGCIQGNSLNGNANLPTSASADGPLDTALAEITVLSVQGDIAAVRVDKMVDYRRYPDATYKKLLEGDTIELRVYGISFGSTNETGTVGVQRSAGKLANAPKPEASAEKRYLADLSFCKTGYVGGLECAYDGWSTYLYPMAQ